MTFNYTCHLYPQCLDDIQGMWPIQTSALEPLWIIVAAVYEGGVGRVQPEVDMDMKSCGLSCADAQDKND